MPFHFELNERQSVRVIEQAIRGGTPMRIDPDVAEDDRSLSARMIEADPHTLVFRWDDSGASLAADLVAGRYCQVQFSLNGAIYMLSVHVIDNDAEGRLLRTSRPAMAQVLERRKFARTQLATATPVTVRWLTQDRLAEASLFNIGGMGIAFRVHRDCADLIHVGDQMEVAFELPGLPRRFQFPVSICNKTAASDGINVIVGVQFQETSDRMQAGLLDELRRFLVTQQQAALAR